MRARKTILCVDHDESALGVLSFVLANYGYKITPAWGAHQAVDLFQLKHPCMLIVVADLPGMGTHTLVERMRDLDPQLPIIVLGRKRSHISQWHCEASKLVFFPSQCTMAMLLDRILVLGRGSWLHHRQGTDLWERRKPQTAPYHRQIQAEVA